MKPTMKKGKASTPQAIEPGRVNSVFALGDSRAATDTAEPSPGQRRRAPVDVGPLSRRTPRLIEERLTAAILECSEVGLRDWYQALLSYRAARSVEAREVLMDRLVHQADLDPLVQQANMVRSIAVWGISNIGAPVPALLRRPLKWHLALRSLDDAFQNRHCSLEDPSSLVTGPAAEVAMRMVKAKARRGNPSGKKGRPRLNHAPIEAILKGGYSDSLHKEQFIKDGMKIAGGKRSTWTKLAKELGLTKPKPRR